jgi:type IV fimbrial biogenesis protein FimT
MAILAPPAWRFVHATGASMAELLVTVAIMAALAGASIPVFHTHLRSSALRAGAEEFVTLVNLARSLAVKDGARVCIARDRIANRVRLVVGSSTPCTTFTKTYGLRGQGFDFRADANGWITLQNEVSVTASTADVVFTPLGFATPGGTYTLSKSGHSLSVVVAPSGRVTVVP